ncbi:MAG: bifunctional DNA-formamidopyrimidine glycosylase/DNA-(apurinic or apyrimidinic site) lyase [Microbacteriaceae bacterium]|nr:bifunctional DNA-formamidopyrimidine glycosylase/DNA-(apurinic or apyrimidinic site) lyase [Cryobacterium sp.]MCC6377085.1 bifunctional DNA-formamidopyrimidine glycosylase/DNA-(apurinic or apyrimidinic site) lyase [Microbacteriaceae bacterium]
MPELPEVEVVRRGLEPLIFGSEVTEVEVFDSRSLRRHEGPAEDFVDRLTRREFEMPKRRGKFLWIPLFGESNSTSESEALLVHLGMSGQMLLRPPGTTDRLTRVRIDFQTAKQDSYTLNFVDQRIFGSLAIDSLIEIDGEWIPSQVRHIARDLLDSKFDPKAFKSSLKGRGAGIKKLLLNQNLISGIGNIYADEALWSAKIHPDTPAGSLSSARVSTLITELTNVLHRALEEGGTSFDWQYKNVNGESGYFSHSLNAYGQQGNPCQRCGRPIIRERFMNRSSHYCPNCQRI